MARTTKKGAYVRIQSTTTINVTMGLQNQNVTNKDAHVPDRLRVNPLWPKCTVLITEGVGLYPSEIVDWPSVKSLEAKKILTIGEFTDTADDEEVVETAEKLEKNVKEVEAKDTSSKSSLEDIAGDE